MPMHYDDGTSNQAGTVPKGDKTKKMAKGKLKPGKSPTKGFTGEEIAQGYRKGKL